MADHAVEAALTRFEQKFTKMFGEDTLSHGLDIPPYDVISTGSLSLDFVLGVGGLVEGRLVEIWGSDGVGKTTVCLLTVAEAQKKHPGKRVFWIDMEQKFDRAWAVAHGVVLDRLHLYQPSTAEDVADAIKEVCQSGLFSLVVLDSVGAMIPKAEKEKGAEDAVVGKQAGIITRMVKINAVEARKTGTVVVFVNQVRANLSYGADTTTGGGFALKHATTMKFKMKRTGTPPIKVKIGGEERIVGHEVAVMVERNGVAPAYRTAILTLFHVPTDKYGPVGIDLADEAAQFALRLGIVRATGAWYTFPDSMPLIDSEGLPVKDNKVHGKDQVVQAIRNNPDLIAQIRTQALATVAGEVIEEDADTPEPVFEKMAEVEEL